MADVLDTIDKSSDEVEEQLLDEFNRIRNTFSEDRYSTIDSGIKTALNEVTDTLVHQLEHSGDRTNLQLTTERHEIVRNRLRVLKALLNGKIPTAYLFEAEENVVAARKILNRFEDLTCPLGPQPRSR